MELLLNLVWIALALMALARFVGREKCRLSAGLVPRHQALLAIACALVLLFPVVSASDDLHPTQAVLEDASKRIHQLSAAVQHTPGEASLGILPALVAACLISLLLGSQWRDPDLVVARLIFRVHAPIAGRSPPL